MAASSTLGLGVFFLGFWALVGQEEVVLRPVPAFMAFVVYLALHPPPFASLS